MIDISGDGIANFGLPPAVARDRIVARGITINGLAIMIDEPGLADYYRTNVIGGPSAFVAVARTFDDFAVAMLQKLEREVAAASVTAAPAPGGASPARSRALARAASVSSMARSQARLPMLTPPREKTPSNSPACSASVCSATREP